MCGRGAEAGEGSSADDSAEQIDGAGDQNSPTGETAIASDEQAQRAEENENANNQRDAVTALSSRDIVQCASRNRVDWLTPIRLRHYPACTRKQDILSPHFHQSETTELNS